MSPIGSVLWALLPLVTLGMATVFVTGWAARRLRSRALAWCGVVALVATVLALALTAAPQGSALSATGGLLILVVLMGGGLALTFTVRERLVDPGRGHRPRPGARPGPGAGRVDPAVQEALARRARRLEARRILENDPALARELRIGRPDLPRRFDDGGLVDVNHVPIEVLAALPGLTGELAERIVTVRTERGPFSYREELGAYADLPDALSDELAERLVFLT
jgi:hypothetical protein